MRFVNWVHMLKLGRAKLRFAPNTRIFIIGAGASGLMAAEELGNKGYTEVMILEREPTAGGKCKSVVYNNLVYEMGAGFCTRTYKSIRKLIKREGLHLRTTPHHPTYFSIATGKRVEVLNIQERIRFPFELLKFFWLCVTRWRSIQKPGLVPTPTPLWETLKDVLETERLPVLHKRSLDLGTAYGFGRSDEVPAVYWLKYLNHHEVAQYYLGGIYEVLEGWQELWKRVAASHNVLYGLKIKAIERKDSVIHIYTNQGDFQCDKLIITSPLDDALNFLDATTKERNLFSQIKSYDYRVYLCEVENIPKTPGVDAYIPENYIRAQEGHPIFWYHRYKDENIVSFYVLAKPDMSDATVEQNIANDIGRLGMQIKRLLEKSRWKYFPHVSTESIKTGFYSEMETLQGMNGTYYAGEILNFSSVKCCGDSVEQLISSYF